MWLKAFGAVAFEVIIVGGQVVKVYIGFKAKLSFVERGFLFEQHEGQEVID